MKWVRAVALAAALACAWAAWLAWHPTRGAAAPVGFPLDATVVGGPGAAPLFAAPGRVEGAQTAIAVGSGATGVISEVLVAEGQAVARGQILARIECDDLVAEAPAREADMRAAAYRAEIVRLGPRHEEIDAANAELRLADARIVETANALRRNTALAITNAVSRQQVSESERDDRMATAQRDAADDRLRLLLAGARPEEIAEARARADAARQGHAAAMARLARCAVRSPIRGTILRRIASGGELVSVSAPQALFVVADTSVVRVRAEIDEEDVGRVVLGQMATVVSARWQGTRFAGRVVEVGLQMGRRRVMTNDPAERSDRDVLEAVVQLDGHGGPPPLPVGLRVSVLFAPPPETP